MQIQDLSYRLNNNIIDFHDGKNSLDYAVSVEVFSFENVYTVCGLNGAGEGTYLSDYLVWGDTERAEGKVKLAVTDAEYGKIYKVDAELGKPVRSVKLRFDNLPLGELINLVDEDKPVTEYGIRLKYPEGWRSLSTPLLVFRLQNGRYLYIRCLDSTVNEKRFLIKKTDGGMRVDVVQEQDGTLIANGYDAPAVEVGIVGCKNTIYTAQSDYIKRVFALDDYENSPIVPDWLRDICLVVTMHMEAFTGHVFHTYAQAYEDVEKLSKLLDGKHILVYLAGWEGRYYYKYGDYTPDERLGGGEELRKSVQKMQALGCKVMAMYGMNMANKNICGVKALVEKSEFESVSGAKFHSGSVDWDGAHHYDFNELVQLNVGNRLWREYLFGQIKNSVDEYGFDGAFLDIAACHVNDKNANLYNGVVQFCDMLRTIKPQFLVAGEGYYDGLSKAMPLFQSGHTDGWLHYHDRASEELFTRFSREFAHLCIGDLSRGSTGVHELGTNTDCRTPLRKGIIPTLALVEDTLEKAPEKVEEVINQAKEYCKRYLDEKTAD